MQIYIAFLSIFFSFIWIFPLVLWINSLAWQGIYVFGLGVVFLSFGKSVFQAQSDL